MNNLVLCTALSLRLQCLRSHLWKKKKKKERRREALSLIIRLLLWGWTLRIFCLNFFFFAWKSTMVQLRVVDNLILCTALSPRIHCSRSHLWGKKMVRKKKKKRRRRKKEGGRLYLWLSICCYGDGHNDVIAFVFVLNEDVQFHDRFHSQSNWRVFPPHHFKTFLPFSEYDVDWFVFYLKKLFFKYFFSGSR